MSTPDETNRLLTHSSPDLKLDLPSTTYKPEITLGKIGQTPLPSTITPTTSNTTMPTSESSALSWLRSSALSSVTTAFNTNPFVTEIRNKGFKPPQSFWDKNSFSIPRSINEVRTRVELNLQYYQFNYIALCGLIAIIAILSQPSLLLTLIVLLVLWLYTISQEVIKIGSFELRGKQKSMAYSAFAIVLLFLINGSTIFTLVGLCGAAVLIHAALHNLTDEQEQSIEMSTDNLV